MFSRRQLKTSKRSYLDPRSEDETKRSFQITKINYVAPYKNFPSDQSSWTLTLSFEPRKAQGRSTRSTMAAAILGAQRLALALHPKASGLICRQFANAAPTKEARLLLAGPDASGIVASFSHLLFSRGCGIVDCTSESSEIDARVDKHSHSSRRMFFQRILFDYSNVSVEKNVIEDEINDLCTRFGMKSQLVRICNVISFQLILLDCADDF